MAFAEIHDICLAVRPLRYRSKSALVDELPETKLEPTTWFAFEHQLTKWDLAVFDPLISEKVEVAGPALSCVSMSFNEWNLRGPRYCVNPLILGTRLIRMVWGLIEVFHLSAAMFHYHKIPPQRSPPAGAQNQKHVFYFVSLTGFVLVCFH